ncbi:MAG: type II toxin-antitoxin system VapC family toxin [Clostridiales bacterium]|jgi:tRNA(fMet)-specific endonuclease VapC|nr:type II toxin-antitoxin system VapC family toxin [Clostridiales bacterium]
MTYMLDTNICVYIINKKSQTAIARLWDALPLGVSLSSVTLAELEYGAQASGYPQKNAVALNQFLARIAVLPFDSEAAVEYGKVRAGLRKNGTPIGPLDMLIASHAKSKGLIIVTNNAREFARVEGLRLEDWTV